MWHDEGRYWKVTRPDHFGWTVLPGKGGPESSEATPLEYLERWMLANRCLGDMVELEAVVETDEGVQVVVSQPFISGRYPGKPQIARTMEMMGFLKVRGFSVGAERGSSFYNPHARLAIFDAATDNFILSEGMAVPVDVIALAPGRKLHRQLVGLLPRR